MNPKSTVKSTALIPQPHGGALAPGGTIGNVGGTGRPPSALRVRLRGSFEQRLAIIESIIDDPEARPADRIRALEVLAKFGLGVCHEVRGDTEAPEQVVLVVRRE